MPSAIRPLVSVVMPIYNSAPYLEEAIGSILAQTFTGFELLLFNDGSIDDSISVISKFSDPRIRLFDFDHNEGYVVRLNQALGVAQGAYVARMDSDDVASPERLLSQVTLMEACPEVGLCGTAYREFGNRQGLVPVPVTDGEIRERMLASSPFGHPTVMMRKSVMDQHSLRYEPSAMPAEDYRLWYEFSQVTQMANLPEPLLLYRVHDTQTSEIHAVRRQASANNTRKRQLLDKGFVLTPKEWDLYLRILDRSMRPQDTRNLLDLLSTMHTITRQNAILAAYPAEWFEALFAVAWQDACIAIDRYGWSYLRPLLLTPKPFSNPFGLVDHAKIIVKCALGWRNAKSAVPISMST